MPQVDFYWSQKRFKFIVQNFIGSVLKKGKRIYDLVSSLNKYIPIPLYICRSFFPELL